LSIVDGNASQAEPPSFSDKFGKYFDARIGAVLFLLKNFSFAA